MRFSFWFGNLLIPLCFNVIWKAFHSLYKYIYLNSMFSCSVHLITLISRITETWYLCIVGFGVSQLLQSYIFRSINKWKPFFSTVQFYSRLLYQVGSNYLVLNRALRSIKIKLWLIYRCFRSIVASLQNSNEQNKNKFNFS